MSAVPSAAAHPVVGLRGTGARLRVRWLGRVPYHEAWSLQKALHASPVATPDDRLLLVEHPPTYTLGRNADPSNMLVDPTSMGAELIRVDRGGDVTFHGPGQLVAYPILTLPSKGGEPTGLPDTPAYVATLEQILIDSLMVLGLSDVGRHDGYPGVWVEPNTVAARKVAAIGVRIERGRTLHGVALNVDTDMGWFDHIVACGIRDHGVTSLRAEGLDVTMREVVDAFVAAFEHRWVPGSSERSDVVWRHATTDLTPFSRGEGPGTLTAGANAAPTSRGSRTKGPRSGSGGGSPRQGSHRASPSPTASPSGCAHQCATAPVCSS